MGDAGDLFPGFDLLTLTVADGVELRVRTGGAGPAVVLLHGHPRTHTTWYDVAPRLVSAGFRVICPDLRGYGQSSKPPPDERHETYCDRAALDHPDRVSRLAVLDSVPIVEALERADARFAVSWWHWFFFGGAPAKAVRVITTDPFAWYSLDEDAMGAANHADVAAAVRDPRTVRAMVEDYAASIEVDRHHDEVDRAAGRRIECPTLVAWSRHDDMADLYGDPSAVWRSWCRLPVASAVIDSGHHVAEQAGAQLAEVLRGFFGG